MKPTLPGATPPSAEPKPYTGRERRWARSRAWSCWAQRLDQMANQEALTLTRSVDALVKMRQRVKNKDSVNAEALWNGYWYVKEKRDYYRGRVAEDAAPWFDGSAFAAVADQHREAA